MTIESIQLAANEAAQALGYTGPILSTQLAMNYIAENIGGTGGVPTPDPGILADYEMLKANVGGTAIVGTGDINTDLEVNFGPKVVKCKTVETESTSVNVGGGLTLSDKGGDLVNESNVTGDQFIPIESKFIKSTGSIPPKWPEREIEVINEETQGDDSQQMIGITSYSVIPTIIQDVSRVYIRFINPVTNFRATVTSDVTGKIVKHIPSRNDFDNGVGLTLGSGEQFFDIPSAIREEPGFPLTIEVFADQSIDVLGDGTNPWRATDNNPINIENIVLERDISKYTREIFISNDAGDDANTGLTLISPKKTINDAITTANSLIPSPSSTDRVSITDLGSSEYILASDIVVPSGMLIDVESCGIKGDSGVTVELNTDSTLVIGRLITGDSEGSTAIRLAGARSSIIANNIEVGNVGTNQIGLRVVAQESNINVKSMEAKNTGCNLILMDGAGNNTQPSYVDRMILSADNCTAIGLETTAPEPLVFNVGLISDQGNTGCRGVDIGNGNLKLTVVDMEADILIGDGNSVSINIMNMSDSNSITVGVGSTLDIWCIEGNPTIINNGTINGYIGGNYYGNAQQVQERILPIASPVVGNWVELITFPDLSRSTVWLGSRAQDGSMYKIEVHNSFGRSGLMVQHSGLNNNPRFDQFVMTQAAGNTPATLHGRIGEAAAIDINIFVKIIINEKTGAPATIFPTELVQTIVAPSPITETVTIDRTPFMEVKGLWVETLTTGQTNPNLKLVPDAAGGVEWVQDPLGVTFSSNLVLDGNEIANRFIYNGTGNVNLTLPPSSNTTLDYTIFIENKGQANGVITVLLDGADTLTGGNTLFIGDGSTVTKTSATNYNSDLVTPATTTTIANLTDDQIGLGIGSTIIFGAGDVENALNSLFINKASKDNVLELDNTTPFTPTADYEPATAKFVQDLIAICAGFKGVYADLTALQTAHPASTAGSTATVTSPNGNLFYWNTTTVAWEDTGTGYIGDMLKLIFDPTGVNGDAFSMDNMVETSTKKILSNIERTNLGNQSGTNTGDQDLSGLALKSNVLEKDNTTSYDPTTDYHPATKKYVDDNIGGTARTMTITPTSNIENLDVSSLSPFGVLFVDNPANRELRSLSGGTNGDVVVLAHISANDLKIKDPDTYNGQQIETPGSADRTLIDYGGCTLVYNSDKDLWFATGLYY